MPRTTSGAVQGLLMDDYGRRADLTLPDMSPYIETASAFVDDVVACAARKSPPLSIGAARLELIERWLAAHCYASVDQPYTSKSQGGASASFQGQTGFYLEGTKYGQMASRLDSTGCLEAIASQQKKTASGAWLGKPVSEQIDYTSRD